jgi:glutaminyl-peptide cyclotransferase
MKRHVPVRRAPRWGARATPFRFGVFMKIRFARISSVTFDPRKRNVYAAFAFLTLASSLAGCSNGAATPMDSPSAPVASASPTPAVSPSASPTATPAPVRSFTYKVVNTYPHDRNAFTQGLLVRDGVFYESTGREGASSLRRVEIETGKVEKKVDVPAQYFAEGLSEFGGKLFQITWKNKVCFVYDRATFNKTGQFSYEGEGWGLTTDGTHLIMSDGTDRIRFINPADFKEVRSIQVTDGGAPLTQLNELEYINGEIYANVWQTNGIVIINPADGKVTGRIDMTGILSPADSVGVDVLNGIAWDKDKNRIFITGKYWPKVFEVKFEAQ